MTIDIEISGNYYVLASFVHNPIKHMQQFSKIQGQETDTFVIVALTNTVWNPWPLGFDARFFNGTRNLRMSGPNPRSNMVSASSNTY